MKNKHLTFEERSMIERLLNEKASFRKIGKQLGKCNTTISKEVKRRYITEQKGYFRLGFNDCKKKAGCRKSYLCKPNCRFKYCYNCSKCKKYCDDYEKMICEKLLKAPYVCNGCSKNNRCTLERRWYKSNYAHKEYRNILSESRAGINLTLSQLESIDEIVSPLIKKGQSIHHIWITNSDALMISEKALYIYVDKCLLTARNIDLPRKVKFKPRRNEPQRLKIDRQCRKERTFDDFIKFISVNNDSSIVEIDTVVGSKGGKVLLTIVFRNCNLLLAYLRDSNSSQSIIDIFNMLYDKLGKKNFSLLFSVILTDNGSEFSNPTKIEFDQFGNRRTNLFYCDAGKAWQKPAVENSHTLIRRFIPKGKSFDNLTQHDIDYIVNNINSYKRKKLNNESAFSLFSYIYGNELPLLLGLKVIDPNDIKLKF